MSRQTTIDRDAPYQSPRNAAYITGLSLRYIRDGCRSGTIPHIRVGSDFRVNMPLFLERLRVESLRGGSGNEL